MKNLVQFPDTYFEDEVRDGFYVSGLMKRAWAAQMEVLAEIDKVCEKHGIPYFADSGNMLGAIRHGGFIPWDDDFDICMKREDYSKFIKIAQEELPKEYRLINIHTIPEYKNLNSVVANSPFISFNREHLEKHHGFPFAAGIDIFPLDNIEPDAEIEKSRCTVLQYISHIAANIERYDEKILDEKLKSIEKACGETINRKGNLKNQLKLLIEKLLMMCEGKDAEELARLPFYISFGRGKFKKEWFQYTVRVPFENIAIPVPAMYDMVLREYYGDYMKSVRGTSCHDYPFYGKQEKALFSEKGIRLKPVYEFSMQDLKREPVSARKTIKEQAEEMTGLLNHAHGMILQMAEAGDIAAIMRILETCQSGAITIGNRIEQSGGEGFVTVGMLEEYCELIYNVYESIARGNMVNFAQIYETLNRQLERIQNSVVNDIKVRREIVFLPFKASAWDGFESLWRVASADPDCDVYVIPIPYYYKNPDGSLGKLHYDGQDYPDYVPVMRYEDYNFAEHRPDMIFIQNPYDECNYTTSVPPFFYSRNLKQYTEQLIYIPYFVLDEIDANDELAVQSMEHFVTMPGVVHADKVIVQSEKMRQAYIDRMSAFAGEDTRNVWEEKILGLGSPKHDKASNEREESREIPEEWRKVLQRPDGSWKKVLLYYTSISSMVQHGGQMLQKIRNILQLFEEKKEEEILLWKADPAIESSLPVIKPQLWEEYQSIVAQYKAAGWGIYDDFSEFNRLTAIADAYYGDGSPLAHLCETEGIPVMLQDGIKPLLPEQEKTVRYREQEKESEMSMSVSIGKKIWEEVK